MKTFQTSVALAVVLLSGCKTVPPADFSDSKVQRFSDLEGYYKNLQEENEMFSLWEFLLWADGSSKKARQLRKEAPKDGLVHLSVSDSILSAQFLKNSEFSEPITFECIEITDDGVSFSPKPTAEFIYGATSAGGEQLFLGLSENGSLQAARYSSVMAFFLVIPFGGNSTYIYGGKFDRVEDPALLEPNGAGQPDNHPEKY
tara:strand:- start:757 stop:1359 length:603 start_codon:yes stop_codon:yes gene_type:complete